MNKKNGKNVPTSAELALLKVLWEIGPATVRQVHESVSQHRSAYTTTLKMLQIMHEKGLVARDESNRAHVYSAVSSQEQMQSSLVTDMVSKAFGGSRFDLVVRALGETTSNQEIAEIRKLLDSLEQNKS